MNDLGPAEEASEAWEATLDGERVGMAVVDTFPSDYGFVCRVAVVKQYRRDGIAAALLSHLYREYGRLVCRVHTENEASQSLVESQGFVRTGLGRYEELIRYDTDEESEEDKGE